jgi:hypothetical protein
MTPTKKVNHPFTLTNQAIDINTLRATSVAQIKAYTKGASFGRGSHPAGSALGVPAMTQPLSKAATPS